MVINGRTGKMVEPEMMQRYRHQAEMLANRVKKRFNHLHRRYRRQKLDVFRLYDWDIPEIRAAVDWYAGHLVVAEYTRRQSVPQWLPMMGAAAADALGVSPEKIHLKERFMGGEDGLRYERLAYTDEKIVVAERDLSFYVNLNDYVDTGLFSDHRNTRQMVRETAAGRDFLNLYCYTGTFSCAAAKGGARRTVSVDRSRTALSWAQENMSLNGIRGDENTLIQADAFGFLEQAAIRRQAFDLAVVDPPSFSTSRDPRQNIVDSFDLSADHPALLKAVLGVMRKGGMIFFSTNHQNFEPRMEMLSTHKVDEITARTIPEDYVSKHKTIHRCWRIVV